MKSALRSLALIAGSVVLLSLGSAAGALGAPASGRVAFRSVPVAVRDYLPRPTRSLPLLAAASVRPGDSLPASSSSAHFKVHYDPALDSAEDLNALLGTLEQAYAKLVAGGGGSPNAGLQAPASDSGGGGDDKIDFYLLGSETQCGSWAAGCAIPEGFRSGYVEILAQYTTGSYSGGVVVAPHEFTHLIQYSYGGSPMAEAAADWGEFWVFPSASNHYPTTSGWSLDCHNTTEILCPYEQFPFIERQVEDYGVSFVDTLFKQGSAGDRVGMRNAIAQASGGHDTLSSRYASFARQLWEPAVWSEPMRGQLTSWLSSLPSSFSTAVEVSSSAPDSGEQTTQVDQLAARYVRVSQQSSTAVAGDRLRISVRDPSAPGIGTPTDVLVADPSGSYSEVALSGTCGASRCATIPFDPASVSYVVIPLVNDNDPETGANIDGLPFTWRVELLPATTQASFTVDHTSGQAPLTVHLTNTSQGTSSYSWSFGDGATSTDVSPSHVFTMPGTYTVTLTASTSGTSSQTSTTIVVSAGPSVTPQASFTVDHASGQAPLTVHFTNTSLRAKTYLWSFGDGATSTDVSPSHAFTTPGTYAVTLTASASGAFTQASKVIVVSARPAATATVASFKASKISGYAPLSVRFANRSRNAASYLWSFGDKSPLSSEDSPSHVFASPGRYTVTLSASGSGGSATKSVTITVLPARPDLAVKLTRNANKRVGKLHRTSFSVTLRNRGRATDELVTIRITLPVGARYVSISFGGKRCRRVGRQAVCSLPKLAPQKIVKLSFVAAAGKQASVRVFVTGKRAETTLANNSAHAATW
ncbi:MAG: PKD domain-containing protein [Gaiellaceae bacterium]|jgi:PKD repeat protein